MAIGRKIIHYILKRERMFHIIKPIYKIKSLKSLQITVCLWRSKRMFCGKLTYYSDQISYLVFNSWLHTYYS